MNIKYNQTGAVLVVALVMLTVLTVLLISSAQGLILESKVTTHRAEFFRDYSLADAALREGEFRLYGPAYIRDKLEPNMQSNCTKNNKLKVGGLNKPCLLTEMTTTDLDSFFYDPLRFIKASQLGGKTSELVERSGDDEAIAWMPYRGLDHNEKNYLKTENKAYWNAYRILDGSQEDSAFNAEYGSALEGKGTFFFLVTAQVNDELAVQSTVSTIYLGLD